ncbi:hypothetical protein ART_1686 [Arthrobacter sp. PAMC 25486]|uniref:FtsK/SpoIIIE domain-containing protein n=1 Tax=Arthrobacter sp. PAMC 25486 TaxID=1494608 RepID=UPI000535D50A|nr:FtsK/SpoIIIE domain-containing protein [Arthrobacter sp. PAMC 25486]AIY01285.1 hypothetical protein ART_1686 [Arthrobacter sp. PAMC 25486]
MLLEVTVVAGPRAPDHGGTGWAQRAGNGAGAAGPLLPTELSVTWPAGATPSGHSLHLALTQRWSGNSFTVAGERLDSLLPGTPPLVDGAVVVAWPDGSVPASAGLPDIAGTARPAEGPALVLAVCSGPGAGAVFALQRGRYTLGRGQCRLRIADPSLSRHHGTLLVGSHGITLSATPGSSGFLLRRADTTAATGRAASAVPRRRRAVGAVPGNAVPVSVVQIDAVPVKRTVTVEVGQLLVCGDSTLELRFQDPAGTSSNSCLPDGAHQPLWPLDPGALNPIEVSNAGGSPRNRGAMVVAGTLPLVLGIVLAVTTGSWMFLSFAAIGAVTVLIPVFGGSARRRALRFAVNDAVRQDAARLSSVFPDAATLSMAVHAGMRPRARPPGLALAVRVGTATEPSAVTMTPVDPAFSPPLVHFRPVCLRLGAVPQRVCGPSSALKALLNYVLMQLDAGAVPVVVLGAGDELPLPARLLPLTTLAASVPMALSALGALSAQSALGPLSAQSALSALESARSPCSAESAGAAAVLIVVNAPLDPQLQAVPGVQILLFSETPDPAATVELRTVGSSVAGTMAGTAFVPDGVPASSFGAQARRRALSSAGGLGQGGSGNNLPAEGRKGLAPNSVPPAELRSSIAVQQQWERTAGAPLQPVPIGRSAAGAVMFDFGRDGPHLLLGGTTGSGKSEFLRALVGSVAVAHSPADVQFMFIDFKGGAGLGVLGKLPHTTSLITDLGGHGMERTLASLRAELHRREASLAAVEAADNDEYRALTLGSSRPAMAHLVIVIDEFRVLVDQFPDTMAELMRIAAVGRSLGIHLVMATQRPQGALNADIRANVTSSICLRVQSAFDSVDVIGTGAAASISVATPGRAYLSRAGGPPREFQSATLRLPAVADARLPSLELAVERLGAAAHLTAFPDLQSSDVAAVAALLSRAWQELAPPEIVRRGDHSAATAGTSTAGGAPAVVAPVVVAPELPEVLEVPAAADPGATGSGSDIAAAAAGPSYWLGLVDVPQKQSLEPLRRQPETQSHLACFGTEQETSRALALVAHQVLAKSGHTRPQAGARPVLYLMDGDGSLAARALSPWVGAHVTPEQLRTASQLIERLGHTARSCTGTLILCISDWGRWVAALRNSPWHGAEDGLAELVRFSPSNMVVAVGGGRELLTATFLAAIPNRIFLGHGSNPESTALWPRLPAFKPLPGRAAIAGPINVFPGLDGDASLHVAQLGVPPEPSPQLSPSTEAGSCAAQTLAVREIPRLLTLAQLLTVAGGRSSPVAGSGSSAEVLLGLGGDGCDPVTTTLAPGSVLPVIGGPGSGKSSFIRVMEGLHQRWGGAGAGRPDVGDRAGGVDGTPAGVDGADNTDSDGGPGTIYWLDDAASLSPQELAGATRKLAAGAAIVAAFPYPGPALSMLPLEWGLRTAQQGIVLMPQRVGDAELFGVRLDTMGAEPPGRAVLLERGRRRWFQFPLEPDRP